MTLMSDSFGLLPLTQTEYSDLDVHDEIHDVWGNRGEPVDMYGQMEEQ